MTIFVYSYTNPLLEIAPDPLSWGLEVDRLYQDIGSREQLRQLLLDSKTHPPRYLLLRGLEELGDNLTDITQNLQQLENYGIQVIALEEDYSTSSIKETPDYLNFWQTVTKNKQKEIRQVQQLEKQLRYLPPPGKAPYGYRKSKEKYLLDRATAPIVKDFFDHFLLYASLRGAVKYLLQKYHKKIAVSTGKNWLINPVYRGHLCYNKQEIILNTHTPILSPEESAQIDRILRRNRRFSPRTTSAPRSLAGLVFCGNCQSKLTLNSVTSPQKKEKYLYFSPLSCPHTSPCPSLAYSQVFEKVIDTLCQQLPLAITQAKLPDINAISEQLQAEIQQKQTIINQISDLEKQGILDEKTKQLRIYQLQTEIAQYQQKLTQLPPPNLKQIAQDVSLPQFWLDLSESERRNYFREFIKQILVDRNQQQWSLQFVFMF